MGVSAAAATPRAMRRATAARRYDVSLSTIDRAVRAGRIRTRKVGHARLLNADDLEQAFGWPDVEPDAEAIRFAQELVS